MSRIQKTVLSVAALLGLVSTSIFAANPGDFTVPAAAVVPIGEEQGFYMEANMGMINHNYVNTLVPGSTDNYSRKNWGWAFGANLGYQFDKFLALEGGFNYFLAAKAKNDAAAGSFLPKKGDSVHPLAAFVAAKVIVPVVSQMYLFAKAGVGYVHQSIPGLDKSLYHKSHWGPMFAVGGQYYINENVSLSATYSRFAGDYKSGKDPLPDFNVLMFGLGYKFVM